MTRASASPCRLTSLQSVLPRLAAGNDLYPGLLGIGMKAGDLYHAARRDRRLPATFARLRSRLARRRHDRRDQRQAGHAAGQFKQELNRHYAGDRVRLVVMRSGERLEREVELAEKIPPYEFPFAGILPLRPLAGKPAGLIVRFVYPDSPAARAGIQAGRSDRHAGRRSRSNRPTRPWNDSAPTCRATRSPSGSGRDGQAIAAELELAVCPTTCRPSCRPPTPRRSQGAEPAVGVVIGRIGRAQRAMPGLCPDELSLRPALWRRHLAARHPERQAGRAGRALEAAVRSARFDSARAEVGRPTGAGSRPTSAQSAKHSTNCRRTMPSIRRASSCTATKRGRPGLSVRRLAMPTPCAAWLPSARRCPAG